jgi:hypothetical protein
MAKSVTEVNPPMNNATGVKQELIKQKTINPMMQPEIVPVVADFIFSLLHDVAM